MNKELYLVQEEVSNILTGVFYVVCRESIQDVRDWIINTNLNISYAHQYSITNISGFTGVINYCK